MPHKNMKNYLKTNGFLVFDNYELIEEEKYFEKLDVDDENCIGIQLFPLCFFSTSNFFVGFLLPLTFQRFYRQTTCAIVGKVLKFRTELQFPCKLLHF